jgi:thioesterase domain-containing protein
MNDKIVMRHCLGDSSMPVTELSEAPLVFVLPGLADDDYNFQKDWGLLGRDLRIVKIPRLDWTDLVQPGSDIRTMISHVKRQIENSSDAHPVRIVGYSIGGFLGYYCALDLQAEGRPPLRLAILDTSPPNQIATGALPLRKRFQERLRKLATLDLRKGLGSVLSKFATKKSFLPHLRRLSRFRYTRLPFNMESYLHHKITWQMEINLILSWDEARNPPNPPLMTPTTVLLSADYDVVDGIERAWRDYCPNSTLIRVAGDHDTMLQPPNNGPLFSLITKAMTGEDSAR